MLIVNGALAVISFSNLGYYTLQFVNIIRQEGNHTIEPQAAQSLCEREHQQYSRCRDIRRRFYRIWSTIFRVIIWIMQVRQGCLSLLLYTAIEVVAFCLAICHFGVSIYSELLPFLISRLAEESNRRIISLIIVSMNFL